MQEETNLLSVDCENNPGTPESSFCFRLSFLTPPPVSVQHDPSVGYAEEAPYVPLLYLMKSTIL